MDLCPELGIAIPVGKDSLSLKTTWQDCRSVSNEQRMLAPVSLDHVSAFAPVTDARRALTPQLRINQGASRLLLVDLGQGRDRLGWVGACTGQQLASNLKFPIWTTLQACSRAFSEPVQRLNQ